MTYKHRVAFNADLFLTVETDNPESPIEDLEDAVVNMLRGVGGDLGEISETGFDVESLEAFEGRIYPRKEKVPGADNERLENLSIENTEEA